MAKVVTDDTYYKQIAQQLRLRTDEACTFMPSQMAQGVEEAYISGEQRGLQTGTETGYAAGYGEGVAAAEAACAGKHFAAVVLGDGTTELSFQLPFAPDVIYLLSNDSDLRLRENEVACVEIDFSTFGQLAGKKYTSTGTSYSGKLCSYGTAYGMFSDEGNGWAKIKNVTADNVVCKFSSGVGYMVMASKFDLKPLKARIEESVARLPDTTCKAYYQTDKVGAAFTTDEWTALVETKPNCTFSLI